MKVRMKIAVTLMLLFTLCGCAGNYVIATKEGEMLLTQGKPVLDKETGMIGYIDEEGNERQINGDRVSQIIER
ncbi:YgdI/YgdR family lipoprotein [Brenneria populi subsp. brevivirga]|uniref:YgdI/YgdR family lipoprotein n=1 Tax=Brenneria populi TaxID=1505588 RepID=UPI002E17638F|nr:YgdI/YgdR family lipoprotein [Brenneria populi subsp. brevivirga]